jgi:predicted lipid-binding transport protein (Tim44 family)
LAAPPAAPRRSWLGPVAGIAAGLGLAALMSHFGMGGEMANILTMVLLAGLAFFAIRFLIRRFGPTSARSGAGWQTAAAVPAGAYPHPAPAIDRLTPAPFAGAAAPRIEPTLLTGAGPRALPAGFDAAAFERVAKLIFIRMQAANDASNLDDLRQFSTPEMFANFRLDLQDRQGAAQQTDVLQLDAQVVDVAQEGDQQIVSVRYHGLLKEDRESPAVAFDEVWHLVRPTDGSREWAIAGIAQTQ